MSTHRESPRLPRPFQRMAWSNLAAQFAEQIGLAAAPLIAVLALGAGAGETGLLQMAQTLPFLLLSAPAGVLADRTSRRRLMVAAESLRAASLVCVLVLALSQALSLPLLAVLGFMGATGTVVYNVGGPSLVPALVPREALAAANGRLELARSSAFAVGPAVAGALVGWMGAPVAYAWATALSMFAIVILRGVPEPPRVALPPRNPLHDLRDGARFVLASPLLRPILITAVIFNIGWFVLQAAYVPYAVRVLDLSPSQVGVTMGVCGAGMVVGALLAPRLARTLPIGVVILFGPLGGLCGAIAMALTLRVPSPMLAGLSFFLFGVGPILWTISSTTLRQAITPEGMLGRAGSLVMMATFGARPVGAALGAVIGSRFGEEACIAAVLVTFVLQFVVISASAVARLKKLPECTEPPLLAAGTARAAGGRPPVQAIKVS